MPRLESRGSGVVIKDNLDAAVAYFPGGVGDQNMALDLPQVALNAEGLLGETYPRLIATLQGALGSQNPIATRVPLRAGTPVTNLCLSVATAGAGTPPTLFKLALLQKTSNPNVWTVLAQTADFSGSALLTSPGTKAFPLTAPFTVPADDAYYVSALQVGAFGTTPAQFLRSAVPAASALTPPGAGIWPALFKNTASTDFPANGLTLTFNSSTGSIFWFGVS
jgi:hypothetical protein